MALSAKDLEIRLKKQIGVNNALREQLAVAREQARTYHQLLVEHQITLGKEGVDSRRAQMKKAQQLAMATGETVLFKPA